MIALLRLLYGTIIAIIDNSRNLKKQRVVFLVNIDLE